MFRHFKKKHPNRSCIKLYMDRPRIKLRKGQYFDTSLKFCGFFRKCHFQDVQFCRQDLLQWENSESDRLPKLFLLKKLKRLQPKYVLDCGQYSPWGRVEFVSAASLRFNVLTRAQTCAQVVARSRSTGAHARGRARARPQEETLQTVGTTTFLPLLILHEQ